MSEIKIVKLKLRRGTNSQRKHVILDQGEITYTTDTKRLFVGNGVLSGGESPASINHTPVSTYNALSTVIAERGDLVVANSKFYQLTGLDYSNISNWADVSLKISNQFNYSTNNTLAVSTSAISAANLKPETISNGLKIENNILQTNFNSKSLEISASQLSLKVDGIDEREINSTSFGDGISGGSGSKISLAVNGDYFFFDNGVLSLTSIPVSSNVTELSADNSTLFIDDGLIYVLPDGITENELNSTSFGNGISGGSGDKISLKYDPNVFFINGAGQLTYNNVLNLSSFDPYSIESTFVGKGAGLSAINAESSVFVGVSAGFNSLNSENSIFIGSYSGYNLSIPLEPSSTMNAVFIGTYSGDYANTSVFSNFIGVNSGSYSTYSTYSNFIGGYSGSNSISSRKSNFIGFESGYALSGEHVNALGYQAGMQTKGNNNTFIGSHTSTLSSDIGGCLVVGMSAQAVESNTIVLGSTDFPFLTSATGVDTLLGLVVRINGIDYTIPLHTRI